MNLKPECDVVKKKTNSGETLRDKSRCLCSKTAAAAKNLKLINNYQHKLINNNERRKTIRRR